VEETEPTSRDLDALGDEERRRRSGSFGGAAEHYERFRPGPPVEAVEWMLPRDPGTVVDLGAGTGAMTRLLVGRARRVLAVEPDPRMRDVLERAVPGATALDGRGEAIPVPDGTVDAVLASSSWHWMEPAAALTEVARVLVPGGTMGAVWAGPDFDGPFMQQARALLLGPVRDAGDLRTSVLDPVRQGSALVIPDGFAFAPVEHHVHRWEVSLTAEDLVGLLGTLSWVILMDDERRDRLFDDARRLLREGLDLHGDTTVAVTYRSDAYRTNAAS
jgi:SAM-dependent methyltransferase